MNKLQITDIVLNNGNCLEWVELYTTHEENDTLFIMPDHDEYGEAMFQLVEGKTYSYLISDPQYQLKLEGKIYPLPSSKVSTGTIITGIDVGTLKVKIVTNDRSCNEVGELQLEVRSIKQTYREDYRQMLSDITDCCCELLMQESSPAFQRFTVQPDRDPQTDYQRFAFVKSIIDSEPFNDALYQIQQNPIRRWTHSEEDRNIDHIKHLNGSELRQIVRGGNRIPMPNSHPLHSKLETLPHTVLISSKEETTDVPENRFIKFVLQSFLSFCSSISNNEYASSQLKVESSQTCIKIQRLLTQPLFRNLSHLRMLPLNSPILQKKEGYREVLQKWLMFDMASRLTWTGGDDVYDAGKKNVATLYEYWLFFKLKDIFSKKFGVKPLANDQLIEIDKGNLSLSLKQGKQKVMMGEFVTKTRRLQVCFCYNRTFEATQGQYESAGSWTKDMRPDYTLSIWPAGMNMDSAEQLELITHVHFDAKYKVEKLNFGVNTNSKQEDIDESLLNRKKEEEKGVYKNVDLYKMHTYKDAIKRTAGAYILYPGDVSKQMIGFHEIVPGLGAFAISPRNYDNTLREFNIFIDKVIDNFLDRTSQRERLAFHTHEVLQVESDQLYINLPETTENGEKFLPSEVNVLVGYCHKENFDWLLKNGYYNFRAQGKQGAIPMTDEFLSAKYLFLWSNGKCALSKINKFKVAIYTESKFCELGYRSTKYRKLIKLSGSHDKALCELKANDACYLVISHDVDSLESEMKDIQWDSHNITKHKPFLISMSQMISFYKVDK